MKIDGSTQFPIKSNSTVPVAVSYRTGDVVVVQAVQVVNVTQTVSEVLARFPNDDLLTTIFNENYNKKEGEFFPIKIQGHHGQRIIAEIVQDAGVLQTPINEVRDLLLHLNLPYTADHYEIATQMLRMGLAQTVSNFELIKKYKALYLDTSLEQIVFMLKNDISINAENIAGIALIMAHKKLVGENLLRLFRLVKDNDCHEELKTLLKAFYKNPGQEGFSFHEIKEDKSIVDLVDLISYLKNIKDPDSALLEETRTFLQYLNFQLELSKSIQSIVYLQIPINNNGNYDTAELYILDKEQEKQEKQNQVLYLRVPTMNMGVVELLLYIQSDKSMQCYMNAPLHTKQINHQIIKLYDMMENMGFRLTRIIYNQLPSDISIHNFALYTELIIHKKKIDQKI